MNTIDVNFDTVTGHIINSSISGLITYNIDTRCTLTKQKHSY